MNAVNLCGIDFVGSRAQADLKRYAKRAIFVREGLKAGPHGDCASMTRGGNFGIFAFEGDTTFLVILGYDRGYTAASTGKPVHLGYLILNKSQCGHLEEVLESSSHMIASLKHGDFLASPPDKADMALFEAAARKDREFEQKRQVEFFSGYRP